MRPNKQINLLFWIVLFESVGFLMGLLTQANISPWYEHLNKSILTPPGYVFSFVWTILYGLLAVVAWLLSSSDIKASKSILVLFTLQMVMNWLWTPLFFGLHWFKLSALWIVSLSCLNAIVIMKAKKKSHKTIAGLLIPYLLWLVFASYLNVVIALMN